MPVVNNVASPDEALAIAIVHMGSVLPCWCDDAYSLRQLDAPDCPRCQFGREVVDLLLSWGGYEPCQ